jgi:predicted DNA-binding transcriptional regulator AlpA
MKRIRATAQVASSSSGDSDVVFFRAADLAKRFKIHPITVWKWTNTGNLPPPVRLGPGTVAWRRSDIESWEEQRTAK